MIFLRSAVLAILAMILNTLLLKQFPGLESRRVSAVEENQSGKQKLLMPIPQPFDFTTEH
jgi:hypothetical protein